MQLMLPGTPLPQETGGSTAAESPAATHVAVTATRPATSMSNVRGIRLILPWDREFSSIPLGRGTFGFNPSNCRYASRSALPGTRQDRTLAVKAVEIHQPEETL